jgi:signal transduction histidine kinase
MTKKILKLQWVKSLVSFLVICIALFYCTVLVGYLFKFPFDFENIFVKNINRFGASLSGYMSPITSGLFILICISILSVWQNNQDTAKYIGGSISLLAGIVSSVLLIGYLYKAPLLYGSGIIPVSLPAAICFLLLSITLLRTYRLRYWTFNILKDNKVIIKLLKSFLPLIIFIIILQGFLIINLSLNKKNPTLATALILFIIISITIYFIINVSTVLGNDLVRAEKALKENEKKLLKLNADKNRFISILGHDLRGPFNNLLGLSEMLTQEAGMLDRKEIEDIATFMNKSAHSTYKLLEDILLWANTQQGKIPFEPEKVSLKEIYENIFELLKSSADAKNIRINFASNDHINLIADIAMLKTIMRNLISNAIKYTNPGGTINISSEKATGEMIFTVSDNGIGISHDNLTKLFSISEILTTKGTANETGTGLGLLLCKEFVEKHGGRIWAESEAGKGSDFKFTIPLVIN